MHDEKLELMLKEQKEYAATLREEYHRQTSENDDALGDGGTLNYST